MKIKIENVGYMEVPDDTPPEQISAAVKRIAAQNKKPSFVSKVHDIGEGVGSVVGQLGAGAVGGVVSIPAAIGAFLATGKPTKALAAVQEVMGDVNRVIGYEPESETGKKIAGKSTKVLEKVFGAIDRDARKMFVKKTDTPEQRAEHEAAGSLVAQGAMVAAPLIKRAMFPPPKPPVIPPKPFKAASPYVSKVKAHSQATLDRALAKVKGEEAVAVAKLKGQSNPELVKAGIAKPPPPVKPVAPKAAGKELNAEQLSILDAFDDGPKHAAPELKPNAKGSDIIFLDFDGVLNKSGAAGESTYFEAANVAALNAILDKKPGARIVVTSSWRKGATIEGLDEMLTKAGVRPHRVIGKTGNLGGDTIVDVATGKYKAPRGSEITEWLNTHGNTIGKKLGVMVLDDRADLSPFDKHQIKPIPNQGLTPEHVPVALETLQKGKPWQWVTGEKVRPTAKRPRGPAVELGAMPLKSPGPGAQAAGINQQPVSIIQLRNSLANVPRNPTSARMQTANRIYGAGATFNSKINAGIGTIKASAAGLWDAYTRPPVHTSFKGALGDYLYARLRFQTEGHSYAKEIKAAIPDKTTREGMVNWIEAQGDDAILGQRLSLTQDPLLKRGYESALKLTPEQKLHAQNISNYFDDMLSQLQHAGILEDGVEAYVTHLWGNSKKARNLKAELNAGLLGTNPAQIKHRILSTYFEGEQLGLTPKNKDIGFLVTAYDNSIKEMLAARTFVKSLTDLKARDGRPLAVVSGKGMTLPKESTSPEAYLIRPNAHSSVRGRKDPATGKATIINTHDYRYVDHPSLRKWKWLDNDPEGAPIMLQGDMYLHPDIVATFAERFQGQGYYAMQNLLGASAIAKNPLGHAALAGLGEFKRTLLSLSGFHQVQVGIHAVFHNVNPFNAPRINLNDPLVARGVRNGLMVTDYSALAEFSEGVAGHSGLVSKIPGIGPGMMKYQEYLFQDYIPRLKVAMFKEAYERNIKRYPKLHEDQIAEITGHQANAAFGELNYKWLGRNKTFQDSLRMFFLAPDFLEARAKFVAQALTPTGKEQLAALVRGSAELYFGARIANYFINDGDFKWDKPFSIVVNKKEYALRTVPGDLAHLFSDPRSFVFWRLNPGGVRPMVEWATGKDAQGRVRTPQLEVMDFIKSGIPIPFQGFMKDDSAPTGERLLASALQSLGINSYVSRSSAEKIAMEAAALNIPKIEQTPESREKSKLYRNIRSSLDREPGVVPKALQDAVAENKVTVQQAMKFLEDRDKPPLERSFERLRVPQQMRAIEKIYDAASEKELVIIRPIMQKKIRNFLVGSDTPRAEREKYKEELLKFYKR